MKGRKPGSRGVAFRELSAAIDGASRTEQIDSDRAALGRNAPPDLAARAEALFAEFR